MSSSFLSSIDSVMKVLLYDKFASILGIDLKASTEDANINKGIILFPKDVALRIIAEKRGTNYLEFINFWKDGIAFDWKRQRTPPARRGLYMVNSAVDGVENAKATIVKAVPVNIDYSFWVWSKSLDTIYQVVETYINWQHNMPKMIVNYNNLYPMELDLHFSNVIDESPINTMFTTGQYFVHKMSIKLDCWLPTSMDIKTIHKIILTMYYKDDLTDEQMNSIIIEDTGADEELAAALKFFGREYNLIEDTVTNI